MMLGYIADILGIIGAVVSAFTFFMARSTKKVVEEKLNEYKLRRDGAEDVRVLKGALKSIREDNLCTANILWDIHDVVTRNSKQDNSIAHKYNPLLEELRFLLIQNVKKLRKGTGIDDVELCSKIQEIIVLFDKEIYK